LNARISNILQPDHVYSRIPEIRIDCLVCESQLDNNFGEIWSTRLRREGERLVREAGEMRVGAIGGCVGQVYVENTQAHPWQPGDPTEAWRNNHLPETYNPSSHAKWAQVPTSSWLAPVFPRYANVNHQNHCCRDSNPEHDSLVIRPDNRRQNVPLY
jgi:hypothetical protein